MRWKFLLPYYWPAWLAIALVWLFALLPYSFLLRIGAASAGSRGVCCGRK